MHNRNYFLATASALALFAATATAGLAQSPGASGGGQEQQKMSPGATDRDPSQGGAQEKGARDKSERKDRSSQPGKEPTPKASDRAEEKASPKSRVQNQDAPPRASERAQEKSSPKSAVRGQDKADDGDRGKRGDGDRKSRKQTEKGKSEDTRRSEREGVESKRGKDAAERSDRGRATDKDRDRATGDATPKGGREERDRSRAEGGRESGDRVQLSEEKRTSVRERITKSGRSNRVTNVNFDIRVGAAIPRQTTLHTLPPDVVEIVPEYRNYRYVYVRDEIVIIDPSSYVVVAVINGDRSARSGPRSGTNITLSADDRTYIRETVGRGPSVRLDIKDIFVGMDLPDTVELRPLPEVVVERYPDLEDHRYFVYEGDVVIVEPRSREVALVIED